MNLIRCRERGFTLIELLIVIAVLGVLATGVLVALNPGEQLARARDADRLTMVAQLGRAMERYIAVTGQNYPERSTTWQNVLLNAGEIKRVVVAPAMNGACDTVANHNNFCYQPALVPPKPLDAIIWTLVESRSETIRAGDNNGHTCATTPGNDTFGNAAYVWYGSLGRAGVMCIGNKAVTPEPGWVLN